MGPRAAEYWQRTRTFLPGQGVGHIRNNPSTNCSSSGSRDKFVPSDLDIALVAAWCVQVGPLDEAQGQAQRRTPRSVAASVRVACASTFGRPNRSGTAPPPSLTSLRTGAHSPYGSSSDLRRGRRTRGCCGRASREIHRRSVSGRLSS
jgi:hypothetical protein